jgi:hypothetical protein
LADDLATAVAIPGDVGAADGGNDRGVVEPVAVNLVDLNVGDTLTRPADGR